MHTGQRQASKMRFKYLKAILNQDISFFDRDARTGTVVESISKDIVLVQDAISEKVRFCIPVSLHAKKSICLCYQVVAQYSGFVLPVGRLWAQDPMYLHGVEAVLFSS